jgi:hypothetical protein
MNAEGSALDSPTAIYGQPRSEFVARFIGEGNFLPGRVGVAEGGLTSVETDGGFRGLTTNGAGRPPGARVLLMVRPEKVWLRARPSGAMENSLPGTVESVRFLGAVTRYRLRRTPRLIASTHEGLPARRDRPRLFAEWRAADCPARRGARGTGHEIAGVTRRALAGRAALSSSRALSLALGISWPESGASTGAPARWGLTLDNYGSFWATRSTSVSSGAPEARCW